MFFSPFLSFRCKIIHRTIVQIGVKTCQTLGKGTMTPEQTMESPLFYEETGDGKDIVLFFHGFPFDHTMWLEAAKHLPQNRRLIFPDLRGFGNTQLQVLAVTSMFRFAQDAADIIDNLDARASNEASKVVVCGLSMGGYIAMHFVRHFGERFGNRLAGLILCDTKSQADSETMAQNRRQRADALPKAGLGALADAMIPNLFATQTGKDIRENVRQMILRQPLPGVAAADRGMAERPDATSWLTDFSLPTLVICGKQDNITPVDEMRCMSDRMPDSRFVVVPNAGHLSPIESPKEFSAVVKTFFDEIF